MESLLGKLYGVSDCLVPKGFGTTGVFLFSAGAMLIVMLAIGLTGPRTKGLGPEKISG